MFFPIKKNKHGSSFYLLQSKYLSSFLHQDIRQSETGFGGRMGGTKEELKDSLASKLYPSIPARLRAIGEGLVRGYDAWW